MRKDSKHRLTVGNPGSVEKRQSETTIRPECLPEPVRQYVPGPEGLAEAGLSPLFPLELTEEQRTSMSKLHMEIRMCNRTVPELRLQIPDGYVSLNLEVCVDYYFKCRRACLEEDAASKVAELLTSFLEQHPFEWYFSYWRNDLVAKLVLGELSTSLSAKKEAGERWLKWYWKYESKMYGETATYLSSKRRAAERAVNELEFMRFMDNDPQCWIRPGFRGYSIFVAWLNKNWTQLAAKKKGSALFNIIARKFRNKWPDLAFRDSDLEELCRAYQSVESSYDPGKVPPYQVVLTLVARKHGVSARFVTGVRAELNKQRRESAPS
jgi:hypothetical protein